MTNEDTLTLSNPLREETAKRISDISELKHGILDFVKDEGFSDSEIAAMEPRELFGHVCIANGVCTADNGMTLFDVAEIILSLQTSPVEKQK